MTAKEAIALLQISVDLIKRECPDIWNDWGEGEALKLAIEALNQFADSGKKASAQGQEGDQISRQAAIDAVHKAGITEYDETLAIEEIKIVPSAQPEEAIPLEWIAKHLEWLDNCDNDFAQLAKVAIRAMVEIWKKEKT